MYMQIKEK